MVKDYIVIGRSNLKAKNGNSYANLKITCQKGEAFTVTVWDLEENEKPYINDIIQIDMDTIKNIKFPKKYDYSGFMTCHTATESDSLLTLIPRPIGKEIWDSCLNKLIEYCSDKLLIDFINKERDNLYEQYKNQTAATSMHHAFKGGLLNHTYELLNMLFALYPTLPPMKIERCIIGIMFHDYGKLKEYDHNMEPTRYMYLMGHTYISAHVLHNKLNEYEVGNEETIRIVHCVLAHHGELEFGSPVVPCTQEALIVNYVDNISAKTYNIEETANMEKSFALGTKIIKE